MSHKWNAESRRKLSISMKRAYAQKRRALAVPERRETVEIPLSALDDVRNPPEPTVTPVQLDIVAQLILAVAARLS